MNSYKAHFAADTTARTLADALLGADVFLGCSAKGLVTGEMLKGMARDPIVFALANPDPEVTYDEAKQARPDAIVATGRSDFPNQVNNVLGFPYIFRGALDVRATGINEAMKVAAAKAIAELAREPVPQDVALAYGGEEFVFGPEYIIPKPFDQRLLRVVSLAVARAACDSGVAQAQITDWDAYGSRLTGMVNQSEAVMHTVRAIAKTTKKRIVFSEGENHNVLEACRILVQEGTGVPILLGQEDIVRERAAHYLLEAGEYEVIDPSVSPDRPTVADELYRVEAREGFTPKKALRTVDNPVAFGAMLVRLGRADAMVAGAEDAYSDTIRLLLPLLERKPGVDRLAGFHLLIVDGQVLILGDTTLQVDPDARALADIAAMGADLAADLGMEPRVAMLSFSNFGESRRPEARKVREATAILQAQRPGLAVDGEMHGDVALLPAFAATNYPHSKIRGDANVLVFPTLDAANISMKLSTYLGHGREAIGPLLAGTKHAVNIASFNSSAREIANLAAFSCFQASLKS